MSVFSFMPWYFIPIMVIGFALPLFFVVRLLKGSAERSRILSKGVPAQATIMRIWETGMRVNHQPQVGFELQVHPPNAQPYVTQTTMVVSALAIPRIQPGTVVPCKFDPSDPSKVALNI